MLAISTHPKAISSSLHINVLYFPSFSVELRELEAKLKSGYMNRERAAQLAEKMAIAMDSQVSLVAPKWKSYKFREITVKQHNKHSLVLMILLLLCKLLLYIENNTWACGDKEFLFKC